MANITTTRQELFTALGEVVVVDGRKKLELKSPAYFQSQIAKAPVGKKLAVTVAEDKATRSRQQLAYYWILVKYIADECGYTTAECHDALMRLKFGTTTVRLGEHTVEVRKSISDIARMPKYEAVELIDYALEVCTELGIHVPTREELGYLPR